jgi:hypothetical protein
MKKASPYILLLVLALAVFVIKKYRDDRVPERKSTYRDPSSDTNRNRGFDRRISYIEYTEHAKCRMQCRKISQPEVEEIMQKGEINYRKTDVNDRPCPSYALEGRTKDNQRVRIVFAQCDLKTKVVTVIDLDTEWSCNCPGDEGKYQNKN